MRKGYFYKYVCVIGKGSFYKCVCYRKVIFLDIYVSWEKGISINMSVGHQKRIVLLICLLGLKVFPYVCIISRCMCVRGYGSFYKCLSIHMPVSGKGFFFI